MLRRLGHIEGRRDNGISYKRDEMKKPKNGMNGVKKAFTGRGMSVMEGRKDECVS